MKTLAVYPFDLYKRYFRDKIQMLHDYERVILITLSTSQIEENEHTFWKVTKDWEKGIEESDTILILPGLNNEDKYIDLIDYSLSLGKEVFLSKNTVAMDKYEKCYIAENDWFEEESEHLYDITVPIITVMSLGEKSEKFDLQLSIGQYFKDQGYHVIQYGSNETSEFFGLKRLPNFMYKDYTYSRKVKLFNRYIYEETEKYRPDLVIIGCSGGIMPYNKYIHNYFGEIPSVVSKALDIDINLVSLYLTEKGTTDPEYVDALDSFCKENFGCEVNLFTMSNIYANYNREKKLQEYMMFDESSVNKSIMEYESKKLFNKNKMENVRELFAIIEEMLKTDFEVL